MKQLNLQKLQNDLRKKFLKVGVKMIGPDTIFFSKDTKIGKNVIIEPYVVIGQKVKIGGFAFCQVAKWNTPCAQGIFPVQRE